MAKRKILMLCDHPMSTSGVGTQARWLINGLVETGKYSFRVFGAALKHNDTRIIKVNEDFIIRPTEGFGNKQSLKMAIGTEKPDALMLFTDPRFFIWLWEMEDEIHQMCPIVYWHLWDNDPWPEYNRVLYESTDLINCINWKTYSMVKERFPKRTNYIPHAVPTELYHPFDDKKRAQTRKALFGNNSDDRFIALWINRNARRKMPGDVLAAWKTFCDMHSELEDAGKPPLLIMHTDPLDREGSNLHQVVKGLGLERNVKFSTKRVEFNDMAAMYNASDCIINIACNEGFGLPTLEAMMCGTPVIAIKTGGMTKQIVNPDGTQNGIAMEPDVRNLVGSQLVPYIYEDHVNNDKLAKNIMRMFKWGPKKRRKIGARAAKQIAERYNLKQVVKDWDRTLGETIDQFKSNPPRQWELTTL